MNFAGRLRELRKEAGYTQEELAKMIGKTRSAVAGYESENKEPDLETLARLAQIFKVSVEYLMGLSDIRQPNIINLSALYIPEAYKKKHEIQASDIKSYLQFMRNQIGILFIDNHIPEEDKDAFLRDISELYWTAKDITKQKEAKKNK